MPSGSVNGRENVSGLRASDGLAVSRVLEARDVEGEGFSRVKKLK